MKPNTVKTQLRKLVSLPIVGGYDKKLIRKFISWLYPIGDLEDPWHFEGIVPYGDNMLIAIDTTNWPGWNIFCFGYYSSHLDSIFAGIVREGDVVLDIGANIGDTTLLLANRTGKSGRVYAFEPFPIANEILRFNCSINGLGPG